MRSLISRSLPARPITLLLAIALLGVLATGPAAAQQLSINDASVLEGDIPGTTVNVTITISPPSALLVVVNFATADGTAVDGTDYVGAASTLTIGPGMTSLTFPLSITADTIGEPDETFFVNLSNPLNATILDGQGVITILDDDAPLFVDGFESGDTSVWSLTVGL